MVKKDLERAGIPYVTSAGVADFHEAGRHTHITELLRSGASLPEARELARHSDIKMTMRYTHIGIDDQAKALAALPNPCQHIVSSSAVPGGAEAAGNVANSQSSAADKDDGSADGDSPSDADQQKTAPPVEDGADWRRRELNPRPVSL